MFATIGNALLLVFGDLLVAFSKIEIDVENADYLVVNVNTRKIVVDKADQTISSSGRLLARFEHIQAIDVEHFINGKRFEWWIVSLRLSGRRKIRIGKSVDEAQLAIVAAHLSTATGKKVCAFSRRGW